MANFCARVSENLKRPELISKVERTGVILDRVPFTVVSNLYTSLGEQRCCAEVGVGLVQ